MTCPTPSNYIMESRFPILWSYYETMGYTDCKAFWNSLFKVSQMALSVNILGGCGHFLKWSEESCQ